MTNSKEVFTQAIIKEEYDYNYFLKIDNRILYKLSQYISHQVYAITLIISHMLTLSSRNIEVSGHSIKSNQIQYHYLKMSFMLQ
mgnify:CR=1 FL=1|jgi:hypothetical protein